MTELASVRVEIKTANPRIHSLLPPPLSKPRELGRSSMFGLLPPDSELPRGRDQAFLIWTGSASWVRDPASDKPGVQSLFATCQLCGLGRVT